MLMHFDVNERDVVPTQVGPRSAIESQLEVRPDPSHSFNGPERNG